MSVAHLPEPEPGELPVLVSISQAAGFMGRPPSTVYDAVRRPDHNLPVVSFGGTRKMIAARPLLAMLGLTAVDVGYSADAPHDDTPEDAVLSAVVDPPHDTASRP